MAELWLRQPSCQGQGECRDDMPRAGVEGSTRTTCRKPYATRTAAASTSSTHGQTRERANGTGKGWDQDRGFHPVSTMVMQRVVGIALGHEDLNDHDELRHDPVLAVLAGELEARAARLRAAGGQVDAEPAGTEPAGADALSQGEP